MGSVASSHNINKGNSFYRKKDYPQARKFYFKALGYRKHEATVHYNLGALHTAENNLEAAIAEYSIALDKNPAYHLAYNNRATCYIKHGNYCAALDDSTRAVECKPDYKVAHFNRAFVLYKLGSFDDALTSYSRAVDLDPKYAKAFNNRGLCYSQLHKFQEALQDLQVALQNEDAAYTIHNLANVFFRKSSWRTAEKYYTKTIKRHPRDCRLYNKRGICLYYLGEYELAAACFEKSCALSQGQFKDNNLNAAKLHLNAHNYRKAAQKVDDHVRAEPQSESHWFIDYTQANTLASPGKEFDM
eukprot:CAMPEP_0115006940 /NCGR_PEP_ID=MMETSP0216-20121206/20826_1 /TAXON_ID=223996 /ORGANISM="Protocruzia adherens, Strain Boccale" /LENGTH=300 /DNA_ID=CAMNT_0002373673 /DNA_START=100 /DNA_END=1002 /DNA_ORIENTATION=+